MNSDISRQFSLIATDYDKDRPKFIPCFNDFYDKCTAIITTLIGNHRPRILDLGTGTGLLTAFWAQYLPRAEFDIIDGSDKMLDIAGLRFEGMENIHLINGDYTKNIPDRRYDAVISALSLHHIDRDVKPQLYKKVYEVVNDNGLFVNYDQFTMDSVEMERVVENDWYKAIKEAGTDEEDFQKMLKRRELDKETTVQEEINLMSKVGFDTTSCMFRYFKFAVIVAKK